MRETVPMIEAVDGVAEVNAPYQVAEALGTVQHILVDCLSGGDYSAAGGSPADHLQYGQAGHV